LITKPGTANGVFDKKTDFENQPNAEAKQDGECHILFVCLFVCLFVVSAIITKNKKRKGQGEGAQCFFPPNLGFLTVSQAFKLLS
jgi:hypothetical protein